MIRDLLVPGSTNLRIRESPTGEVTVQDLSAEVVSTQEDILALIARGEKNRSVTATDVRATCRLILCATAELNLLEWNR